MEESITFLEEARQRLITKHDAAFLCRIAQAEKRLNLGQHHDCLEILKEVHDQLEPLSDVDSLVYANQANVFAQYYRRKEDHENFYKQSL